VAENVNAISGKVGLDTTDFKANIAALNRDIKLAQAEFSATAASMDKWSDSQAGLQARMESLTKVSEAQREKVANLKEIYKQVAAEKGENSRAAQDLEIKILKEQAALNTTEKELRQTSTALDNFGKESGEAGAQTNTLKEHLEGLKGKLKDIGGDIAKTAVAGVAAVGAAVAGAAAGAFKLATAAGEQADELLTMSAKTNIAVESLQEMEYASRFVDVELGTMTGSMSKLVKSMDNAKEGSSAFDILGVKVRDSGGQLRDQQAVWYETIDALGKVGNETERNALAMQIFGKSAMELNPLIKAGGEELRKLGQEARDLGVVLSEEAVNQAGKFDDMMQRLQATTKAFATNVGVVVMPAFEAIIGAATSIIPKVIEAVKTGNWDEAGKALSEGLGDLVDKATKMLPGLAEAAGRILTAIVDAIAKAVPAVLPAIIGVTVTVIQSIVQTMIDNAPMIVSAAVDGVKTLIIGLMDALPKILELGMVMVAELAKGIAEALPELIPAAISLVDNLIKTLLENLPLILDAGTQLIMGLVKGIIAALPNVIEAIMTFIPDLITAGVQLFIALIDAIPEAVILIVAALPQIIIGIVEGLMKSLPQIVQAGVDLFVALVRALPEIIRQIVAIIPTIIGEILKALVAALPDMIKAGVQLFVALVKSGPTIIIEIVKLVPQIIGAIIKGFTDGIGQMVQVGKDLIAGLWRGIAESATWLWDQVAGFFTNLVAKIKQLLRISSPSGLFADEIGKNMGLGITEGLKAGLNSGLPAVYAQISQAVSQIQAQIDAAAKAKQAEIQANAEAVWADIEAEKKSRQDAIREGAEAVWADIEAGAKARQGTGTVTYVFNSPKALSEREIKQQMLLVEQWLALQGV